MKAPLSWLKDYVNINVPVKQLADDMTMSGSKVEEVIEDGKEISNVVICKIIEIERHPDADKLVITKADIGSKVIQIVTGAPNAKVDTYVPVALDGASLAGGLKIKTGKLRGVVSEGMFCSAEELGKTHEDFPGACEDGLLILNDIGYEKEILEEKRGADIKEFLGINETVIDFEITNNRPDCFSIIGLAREAAVTLGEELKVSQIKETGTTEETAEKYVQISVKAPDLCPRYIARVVKDVKIQPSPKWMRDRLNSSGIRAINNIVDITNYVMLEYGQPMHAFDYRNIENGHIIVRRAEDGEIITTLDEEERALKSSQLVICDEKKPIAVAGVMGGLYSGINDDTSMIVFEAAVFDSVTVRLGAKALTMRTESSSRFEKGLDLNNCMPAIDRACELIEMIGAGTVVKGYIDVKSAENKPAEIEFRPAKINEFLGTDIPETEMIKILENLGMSVKNSVINVPTFRPDVKIEADVAEEIARFYGYNKIESTLLSGKAATRGGKTRRQKLLDQIKNVLFAQGVYEALTFSFSSPKMYEKLCLPVDDYRRKALTILNPLGEDFSVMRTSMVPSMLQIISTNFNRRVEDGRLFEIAFTYHAEENSLTEIPEHRETLVIGSFGREEDFFAIKGMIEEILEDLKIKAYEIVPFAESTIYHPGRCAKLIINGEEAGMFGEIHPVVADNFECPICYVAEIFIKSLVENAVTMPSFKDLPKYPAVTRDLALTVKDEILSGDIEKIIVQRGGRILENYKLFDVYKGAQVQEGMKSMAYSLVFRAEDKTLNDDEIQKVMDKILHGVKTTLGAELR